ncbi:hypothetical protein BDFG_05898 [Blastomyces dermatitidis ATCC 26199]|nr:hypothetical protein BDFG_05898 [Blastomyces dermatitidis ATCC 26199]
MNSHGAISYPFCLTYLASCFLLPDPGISYPNTSPGAINFRGSIDEGRIHTVIYSMYLEPGPTFFSKVAVLPTIHEGKEAVQQYNNLQRKKKNMGDKGAAPTYV